jgi:hypothetical protein
MLVATPVGAATQGGNAGGGGMSLSNGDHVEVPSTATAWQGNQDMQVSDVSGEVKSGPTPYQGQDWYSVDTDRGEMWLPEPALQKVKEAFEKGQSVRMAEKASGWKGSDRQQVPQGVGGEVQSGPEEYQGKDWYKVDTNKSGQMWLPEDALEQMKEARQKRQEMKEEARQQREEMKEEARQKRQEMKDKAEQMKEEARQQREEMKEEARQERQEMKDKAEQMKEEARQQREEMKEEARQKRQEMKEEAEQKREDARQKAKQAFEKGQQVEMSQSATAYANGQETEASSGVSGEVLSGPEEYKNEDWYEVDTDDSGKMWLPEKALQKIQEARRRAQNAGGQSSRQGGGAGHSSASAAKESFTKGSHVQMAERSTAYKNGQATAAGQGTSGEVVSGPDKYENRDWYKVDTKESGEMWLPEDALKQIEEAKQRAEQKKQEARERAEQKKQEARERAEQKKQEAKQRAQEAREKAEQRKQEAKERAEKARKRALEKFQDIEVSQSTTAYKNGQATSAQPGMNGEIRSQPTQYQNKTWYEVQTQNDGKMWLPENALQNAAEESAFLKGEDVSIDKSTDAYHQGQPTQLDGGESGEVLSGPTDYKGSDWFKVGMGENGQRSKYWVPRDAMGQ